MRIQWRGTVSTSRQVQSCVALLMLAFSVMSYFNRTIMSIAGPAILKEFALSETEMGAVYSAFILSYHDSRGPLGRSFRATQGSDLDGCWLGVVHWLDSFGWTARPWQSSWC